MSTRPVPQATRQSAVFAAIVGLHVAALVAVTSSLGSLHVTPPVVEWSGPLIPLPKIPPLAVSRPEPVAAPDYNSGPIPTPLIDFGEAEGEHAPLPGDLSVGGEIGAGPELSRGPVEQAPVLRFSGSRLAALVDSCYPSAARRRGAEGRGVVRIVVDSEGRARNWNRAESTGFEILDPGMDCVARRLQFEPARRDGRAVEAAVQLPVVFRLR